MPKPSTSTPKNDVPKFMGNQIYKSQAQRNELNVNENLIPSQGKYDFKQPPSKFL